MAISLVVTFAVSLWIVLYAVGVKSFDAFIIALAIVVTGAGIVIAAARSKAGRPQD
jgi:Mn2+/Fe2+ NRAMP family transporter